MVDHHTRKHNLNRDCPCDFCIVKRKGTERLSWGGKILRAALARTGESWGILSAPYCGEVMDLSDILWWERRRIRRELRQQLKDLKQE